MRKDLVVYHYSAPPSFDAVNNRKIRRMDLQTQRENLLTSPIPTPRRLSSSSLSLHSVASTAVSSDRL
jgi:hypothetical protein